MSGASERQSFFGGILVVWVFSEGFFSLFPIFWGFCYIPLHFLFFEMGDSSHTVWTLRPLLPLFLALFFKPPLTTRWSASHFSDLSIETVFYFSAELKHRVETIMHQNTVHALLSFMKWPNNNMTKKKGKERERERHGENTETMVLPRRLLWDKRQLSQFGPEVRIRPCC